MNRSKQAVPIVILLLDHLTYWFRIYMHFLMLWADWRSEYRRGLRNKGSLVRDLVAAQFVVVLSKPHLPTT